MKAPKIKLAKSVELTIFQDVECKQAKVITLKAPPGEKFTPDGVDKALADFMNILQTKVPATIFKAVRTGFNKFSVMAA